jgi:hypothetical protein
MESPNVPEKNALKKLFRPLFSRRKKSETSANSIQTLKESTTLESGLGAKIISNGTLPARPKPVATHSEPGLSLSTATKILTQHDPVQTENTPASPKSDCVFEPKTTSPAEAVSVSSSHDRVKTPSSPSPRSFWERAEIRLKSEEEDLMENYQRIMDRNAGVEDTALPPQKKMMEIIERGYAIVKNKEWKIRIPFRKDQVSLTLARDKIIGLILGLRDVLNTVASLDPVHAGIPIAAVCILLSVSLIRCPWLRELAKPGRSRIQQTPN